MSVTEQGRGRLTPLAPAPSDPPAVSSAVRHGHRAMVEELLRDFELAAERICDLDEIPMDLLARFARALNQAERRVMARVHTLEEETT